MTLNTKTIIKTPEGENYKDGESDLTLGKVVASTLAVTKSTDPWKSYKLTNDFLKDTVDLKAEDIVFIKDIFKESTYLPYVIGQVFEILEGNAEKTK